MGDTVAAEDPLIELESDKATMEVPSPAAGKVKEIKVGEGDKVSEGTLIMVLEGRRAGGSKASAPSRGAGPSPPKGGAEDRGTAAAPGARAAPVTDAGFGKVHASPSVRAFARRSDIDLNKVNGIGPQGPHPARGRGEVLQAGGGPGGGRGRRRAQGGMGIPPIPPVDFSKFGKVEDVEMSRIKKLSGPALHRSWLNIPHVTHNDEADITELDKYRKEWTRWPRKTAIA